jgi:hypothetical protein
LINLIKNELQITSNLWVKRLLVDDDMQSVAERGPRVKDFYNILLSIILVGAYIETKNITDAKELLRVAFAICIEAPRDRVASNDQHSLVLLARILSLSGFEHDARIVFSAVFSILDPKIKQIESGDAGEIQEKNHDIAARSMESLSIIERPAIEDVNLVTNDISAAVYSEEDGTAPVIGGPSTDTFEAESKFQDLHGKFTVCYDGDCEQSSRRR